MLHLHRQSEHTSQREINVEKAARVNSDARAPQEPAILWEKRYFAKPEKCNIEKI